MLLLSSRDAGNAPEADDDWSDKIQPVLTITDYSFDRSQIRRFTDRSNALLESVLAENVFTFNEATFEFYDCMVRFTLVLYPWLFDRRDGFFGLIWACSMASDRDLRELFRATGRLVNIAQLMRQRLHLEDVNYDD